VKVRSNPSAISYRLYLDGKRSPAAAQDGDANLDTKHLLSYIQLEKQNERLKEALLRYMPFLDFTIGDVVEPQNQTA